MKGGSCRPAEELDQIRGVFVAQALLLKYIDTCPCHG